MKIFQVITTKLKRRYKRWERRLMLSKRQQFVLLTAILTAGLMLTQLVSDELRYPLVLCLSLASYLLTAFGLREDLRGAEWLTLLLLPTLFTTAIALFYFLLPVRWLTRLPVAALYAIGIYALLLTENIYNVAANRTIGLLRAAHSVGFLLTLVTYFFLIQTILAFRFSPGVNLGLVSLTSALLFLPSLWTMELTTVVSRRVWQLTAILSLVQGELAWIFSFWPVTTTIKALFFISTFYSLAGLTQLYLMEKLYKRNVWELFSVTLIVLFLVLFTTHWRGNF